MKAKDIITSGSFNGIIYYRTKDNRADYKFDIQSSRESGYRIYIESQPSYSGRDDGPHPTHRLTEAGSGRKYICWIRTISSIEEAKQVTALWSDLTQEYIRTGKRFGPV